MGCGNFSGSDHDFWANSNCFSMASGTNATCEPKSNNILGMCVGPFKAHCPANNGVEGTIPYMYHTHMSSGGGNQRRLDGHAPIKCKACGFRSASVDEDPEAGKYLVELAWGRNAKNGAIAEGPHLSGYGVWIVDQYGRNGQPITFVYKKTTSQTCCNSLLYQVVVAGTWPTDSTLVRFAVMPFQEVTNSSGSKVHIYVPRGIYFDNYVDKVPEAGVVVTKVTQVMAMEVATCAAANTLKDSPAADEYLRAAYAESSGIERKYINLQSKAVENCNSGGRRLQTGNPTLKGTFQVILPSDYSGTFSQTTVNTDTFASTLNTLLAASGDSDLTSVTVSNVAGEAPTVNAVTVDTPTDGARPLASLAISCVAVVLALAGRLVA